MTRLFVKNIWLLGALCASISRVSSVELTVTPATVANDYVGKIVLAVTGTAPGTASRIEKYIDLNANGVIDAGDALIQSFTVIDGAEPVSFVDGYSRPGEYVVMPMLPGFVGDFRAGMAVVNSGMTALNLSAPTATRMISGKLQDSSNDAGIPEVLLLGQSSAGQVAIGFTDSAGNFSLGVVAGGWQITPERGGLALLGCVGLGDNATVSVSTVAGNVSNVNLAESKANALIYGTLKDNQLTPVVGIQVWASESNGRYKTKGMSFASEGNFCLGVVAGSWQLQTDEEALARLGYSSQGMSASVGVNRAARLDVALQRVTAHLRGRLVDASGAPVGAMRIGVSDHASRWIMTETDQSGQFDIGVSAGAWYLQLETDAAQERSLLGPDLPAFNVVDGLDRNNILVTALRSTTEIRGSVTTSNRNPSQVCG